MRATVAAMPPRSSRHLPDNRQMTAAYPSKQLSMTQVLICGAAIVTLSMGIRHGFGLWLQPITMDRGWSRETFALAIAFQNLAWGLAGPIAGGLADRFGALRVLLVGSVFYAAGLVTMALSTSGLAFMGSAGLLLGLAQSGTTYAIVYGVIARQVDPAKRSWAMGITAAAGSFGQFLMIPTESWLIGHLGWQSALFILGAAALLIAPLAYGLREPAVAAHTGPQQSVAAALREAFAYPSFRWLTAGYFVCGFHLAFIAVHMPSYLKDKGLGPEVATGALMLIGLFNVFGTYGAGWLGQRMPKKHILSAIYLTRAVAILGFVALPLSPATVYVFSSLMGMLWLSTVPATNSIVAQIFGVRYMSMLGGCVFLSHQVGSFLGAWMGGKLYGLTGNYDLMWSISVALGVFAALANLPVREVAIARPTAGAIGQPA
jgi:MFS family permease